MSHDQRADAAPAAHPTAYVEPEPPAGPRLAHFPVTFFATVMGMAGLSLAWSRAVPVLGVPGWAGKGIFWISLALYAAVLAAYVAKVLRHRESVREELAHPVRLSFVPAITIALILVATAGQDTVHALSGILWWIGMAGQLILTLYVLSAWIERPTFAMQHVTPAWFIRKLLGGPGGPGVADGFLPFVASREWPPGPPGRPGC